ncbi:MAG: MaoC/PaaZ C-terminal domain-containing protein [Sagittula sp.]|uniref:MaoC/PaaZ C-terminal domain-containing protein n=1 Tax=Sagittula sp. TaxID=2038081 RepID=UPI0040596DB7
MDLNAIQNHTFAPVEQSYTARDTMLYALGLGYGSDPLDTEQLAFVYEDGLKAVPSLVNVLAHPGFWAKDPKFGIDWVRLLHGEQSFVLHRALPTEGTVRGEYSVDAVEDMGADKGAKLYQTKKLYDTATGDLVATVLSTLFMRGDGGQGGYGKVPPQPEALPDAAPDAIVEIPTLPQQALIYRLSGDYNPIHADPAPAKKAGFPAPILHGLCSLGIATRAILQACADNDPARLKSLSLRFSRPVFPGETLAVEIFRTGSEVQFRCKVPARDTIVLDRGRAEIA